MSVIVFTSYVYRIITMQDNRRVRSSLFNNDKKGDQRNRTTLRRRYPHGPACIAQISRCSSSQVLQK